MHRPKNTKKYTAEVKDGTIIPVKIKTWRVGNVWEISAFVKLLSLTRSLLNNLIQLLVTLIITISS